MIYPFTAAAGKWVDHLPAATGNVLQFYQWCVYAFVANELAVIFFNGSDAYAWFGFNVPFLVRPFGELVIRSVADVLGRRIAVPGVVVRDVRGYGIMRPMAHFSQ